MWKSPAELFKILSVRKKLQSVDIIFSFLLNTSRNKDVAVDFYDGSIIYDFKSDLIALCDVDFFRKAPAINDRGEEWFGTKRLKAHVFSAMRNHHYGLIGMKIFPRYPRI